MHVFKMVFFCMTCLHIFGPVKSKEEHVSAKPGENVTLECQGPKGADIKLVKWDKSGLQKYVVFVFKESRIHDNLQHPSFKNRLELRDPQMKDGNFSVILKNVNINDNGTYECQVMNNNTQPPPQSICNITVTVIDSGGGAGHTEEGGDKDGGDKDGGHVVLPVVLSVFALAAVVVGFVIYRKKGKS